MDYRQIVTVLVVLVLAEGLSIANREQTKVIGRQSNEDQRSQPTKSTEGWLGSDNNHIHHIIKRMSPSDQEKKDQSFSWLHHIGKRMLTPKDTLDKTMTRRSSHHIRKRMLTPKDTLDNTKTQRSSHHIRKRMLTEKENQEEKLQPRSGT